MIYIHRNIYKSHIFINLHLSVYLHGYIFFCFRSTGLSLYMWKCLQDSLTFFKVNKIETMLKIRARKILWQARHLHDTYLIQVWFPELHIVSWEPPGVFSEPGLNHENCHMWFPIALYQQLCPSKFLEFR